MIGKNGGQFFSSTGTPAAFDKIHVTVNKLQQLRLIDMLHSIPDNFLTYHLSKLLPFVLCPIRKNQLLFLKSPIEQRKRLDFYH